MSNGIPPNFQDFISRFQQSQGQGQGAGQPLGGNFSAPPPAYGAPVPQTPIVGDQLSSPGAYAPPALSLPGGPVTPPNQFQNTTGANNEAIISAQGQLSAQGQPPAPYAQPPGGELNRVMGGYRPGRGLLG